jgi:uncharacterized membrane protein YccC
MDIFWKRLITIVIAAAVILLALLATPAQEHGLRGFLLFVGATTVAWQVWSLTSKDDEE